jgi:hypothetical protein
MNINVKPEARAHFWQDNPDGTIEFWSFRYPPPCKVGDPLIFRFDGVPVAKATCCKIEGPGQSKCEGTGRFGNGHKVFWQPETFKDLRGVLME